MKARLVRNSMQLGHIAGDYIRMVHESHNSLTANPRCEGRAAHAMLESLNDHDRTQPPDLVVPVERLVTVLTESLQDMPLDNPGDRTEGAKLYRGCRVRLVGIPERQFKIRDIYWDYGEVRIKEIGGEQSSYLVPWDCLEIVQ